MEAGRVMWRLGGREEAGRGVWRPGGSEEAGKGVWRLGGREEAGRAIWVEATKRPQSGWGRRGPNSQLFKGHRQ